MDTKTLRLDKLAKRVTLFVFIFAASSTSAQQGWIPPDVLFANDLSCKINETTLGWSVEAWARYANAKYHHNGEPWHLIIGIVKEKTERKSRRSANEICTDWMLAVRKKQIEKEKENEKVPVVRIDPVIFTWR